MPRGIPISDEERWELSLYVVKRYKGGETIRDLAAVTRRSYGLVHKLVSEAGVMRKSGGGRRVRAQPDPPAIETRPYPGNRF